ncbi:MAG: hypothetical protein M1812_006172 [Candelaria pacifica]|nr:MAG: hypothetical protein M1812_006172 [Candelaria pacifica]
MSDYDYDFDDDELYAWDDEILDTASWKDDLAEHTMHSPVYTDIDPRWETSEYFSDWEYYSDDYYDNERSKPPKQLQGSGKERQDSKSKRKRPMLEQGREKKRRLTKEDDIPAMSLGEPGQLPTNASWPSETIIWRKTRDERKPPVLEVGEDEKVALLKDWRNRFKDEQNIGDGDPSTRREPVSASEEKGNPRQNDDTPNTSESENESDLDPTVPRSPHTGVKNSPTKKVQPLRKQRGIGSSAGRLPITALNGKSEATKLATSGLTKHSNAGLQKNGQGTKRKAPDGEAGTPRTRPKRVTPTRPAKHESSTADASAAKTTRSGRTRRS